MKIRDALTRLRSHPSVLERLLLSAPIDGSRELANLCSTAEAIINARRKPTSINTDADSIVSARAAWSSCGGDLNALERRQIRTLCWDKETAINPKFVDALMRRHDLSRKRVWIEGIISAYFSNWRFMAQAQRIEMLLRDSCEAFRGNSIWLSNCRKFADKIFSAKADEFIGHQIVRTAFRISPVLEEWNIPLATGLGPASARAAVEIAVGLFLDHGQRGDPKTAIENLKGMFEGLLSFPTLENATFGKGIGDIIGSKAAATSPELQLFIKEYVRKSPRLGDPRLPVNAAKWNVVSENARRMFISWLAQDDLLFFFERVIPDGADPHDRKRFWLQYLDYVEDSCVALCLEDKRRIRRDTFEKLSYSDIADSGDVSAFIMRFRGIIVVEFSRPNNAIYVHGTETFLRTVGHFRTSSFHISTAGGLKDRTSHVKRFRHLQPNSRWQYEVRNYLAGLGIRIK